METTTKPLWFQRLVQLWRRWFPPAPSGPCKFCGEPTTDHNMFNESFFRHDDCVEKYRNQKVQEEEDRRLIDLYKQAIREVEKEKFNPADYLKP